jgi:hypothetical protein
VPLPPTGLKEPHRLAAIHQSVDQELVGASREQAGAGLTEHGVVQARAGQLEADQALPVDPGADRVGGPTVAEILAELEYGDRGQPQGY